MRPTSIITFERLYLASFAVGLIGSAMSWSYRKTMQAANPMLVGMEWIMPTTLLIGIVISLTLWYFIVRRPSVVAKWVVVAFAALSTAALLIALFALVTGRTPSLVSAVLSLIGSALYVASAVMLFKPDARAWLGEATDEEFVS